MRIAGAGLLLVAVSATVSAQTIKVGVGQGLEAFIPVLNAVYTEMGTVKPEFFPVPAARAISDTNQGVYDADAMRVPGALVGYDNVTPTTEPFLETSVLVNVLVVNRNKPLRLSDLGKYRLGHVRGMKVIEGLVAAQGWAPQVVNTMDSLVQMLSTGRIDVALTTSLVPISQADRSLIGDIVTLDQPVLQSNTFHVFNKKWAHLIPEFDAALRRLKASGRWQALVTAAVSPH